MDLENFLNERAKIFDRALNGNLSHREPKIFYDALRWIPLSGGKRLRPTLAMLSCEAVGGVPEATNLVFDLRENYKIFCSIVVYPVVPKDQARIRVQLSAAHEKEHLDKAIRAFEKIGKELKVLSAL